MTHDDELIERVALAMAGVGDWTKFKKMCPNEAYYFKLKASRAISAVRAYDAERRASVLDAAAAAISDPDDYRDLPMSMTESVRFKGGLTEGK